MGTNPSPSRKAGIGPLQFAILRAIGDGVVDYASIRKHVAAKTAAQNFNDTMMGLARRGYITPGRGRRYHLAQLGWDHLPRPDALIVATGHYQPPTRPPMRAGADDWRRAPSVAAGLEREYVPHV